MRHLITGCTGCGELLASSASLLLRKQNRHWFCTSRLKSGPAVDISKLHVFMGFNVSSLDGGKDAECSAHVSSIRSLEYNEE